MTLKIAQYWFLTNIPANVETFEYVAHRAAHTIVPSELNFYARFPMYFALLILQTVGGFTLLTAKGFYYLQNELSIWD